MKQERPHKLFPTQITVNTSQKLKLRVEPLHREVMLETYNGSWMQDRVPVKLKEIRRLHRYLGKVIAYYEKLNRYERSK